MAKTFGKYPRGRAPYAKLFQALRNARVAGVARGLHSNGAVPARRHWGITLDERSWRADATPSLRGNQPSTHGVPISTTSSPARRTPPAYFQTYHAGEASPVCVPVLGRASTLTGATEPAARLASQGIPIHGNQPSTHGFPISMTSPAAAAGVSILG